MHRRHRRFQPQESGGDPMVMREVEIREVSAKAYLNNPRDTPPAELLTDICLPLR
jgi:hypothetical protein